MVTRTKKIFVGGVSASTTEEDLTNYFKQHGEVSNCHFCHSKVTCQSISRPNITSEIVNLRKLKGKEVLIR